MQKENPVANSFRQIKILCAKYKFAERSHNFFMQLPMQLIFSDRWDLDKLQTCAKEKSILKFRSVSKGIRNIQKIATEQKSTKTGMTDPAFGEHMFIWLVQHPCKMKLQ